MGANLDGVVFGTHAALPALRARGGGAIVATASLAGLTGVPSDPLYAANKHAVVGLTRSLGPALAGEGIRFNAVCPGYAESAIIAPFRAELLASGVAIIPGEKVAGAVVDLFAGDAAGECVVDPARARAAAVRVPRRAGTALAGYARDHGRRSRLLPHPRRRRARRARPAGRGARAPLADVRGAHAHPGEPGDARRRPRGRAAARAQVRAHLRPVRGDGDVARRDVVAARRQRHLPRHRARPDHHGQGGREPRPPLGRALRLRRRRGLEPRGDGEPRHRPAHAHAADARARPGDEGDLDAARGDASTASSSPSTGSGAIPSRCSGRTRRSSSAAAGPTVLDRVLEYGDAWMPNHRDASAERIAELRERAGRRVPVVRHGRAGRPGGAAAPRRRRASTACCSGCPRPGGRWSRRRWTSRSARRTR